MGGALNSLDDEWLQSLVHNTRVLNPHFVRILTGISSIALL